VSVTKTKVYTILRDVCIVSNRLTYISDVGNRIDGASPCKTLIPICNIISKGTLCSSNSKYVLYLPNIYVSVARVAEVSYLLFL
jgi:hypothetical protein